jgi:hypothetical protein
VQGDGGREALTRARLPRFDLQITAQDAGFGFEDDHPLFTCKGKGTVVSLTRCALHRRSAPPSSTTPHFGIGPRGHSLGFVHRHTQTQSDTPTRQCSPVHFSQLLNTPSVMPRAPHGWLVRCAQSVWMTVQRVALCVWQLSLTSSRSEGKVGGCSAPRHICVDLVDLELSRGHALAMEVCAAPSPSPSPSV